MGTDYNWDDQPAPVPSKPLVIADMEPEPDNLPMLAGMMVTIYVTALVLWLIP